MASLPAAGAGGAAADDETRTDRKQSLSSMLCERMAEDRKPDASVLLAFCHNEPRFFDVKRHAAVGAVAQAGPGRSMFCASLLGAQRKGGERSEDQLKSKNGEKHTGWHAIESDAGKPPEDEATEQNGN
jgi:hypothetical protein